MEEQSLDYLSAGHPTYWPTDRKKIPDLLDFCITKGIARSNAKAADCYDLSSDHSPIIVTVSTDALESETPKRLTNTRTKWNEYKILVEKTCRLDIPLQTQTDIDVAAEHLKDIMKLAAEKTTPIMNNSEKLNKISNNIQELIRDKRKIRRQWQQIKSPTLKWKLNRAIKALKFALREENNKQTQNYLSELSATNKTDYSLWKATKHLKRPANLSSPIRLPNGDWARSDEEKANTFASHLEKVFSPHDPMNNFRLPEQNKNDSTNKPIKFKWKRVKSTINNCINQKKAPGYDLITGKMLRELPDICIKLITYIFNAILRICYIPQEWKISQITMIHKPGKQETQISSYRPISMLPTISKLFEKMLLTKLKPVLEEKQIIPNHQFGFRNQHGTIEQVHRIVNAIKATFEEKKYCSAVFLDVAQAFDKVWHDGLIYKLKQMFPKNLHLILENYLLQRQYLVKYNEAITTLKPIRAGVPQGSVLGPVLYLLYTADLPTTNQVLISTFADDTAILVSNKDPQTASRKLQNHLLEIEDWLRTWRIKVNEAKSSHVTFTLNKCNCPTVELNGVIIPQRTKVKYLGLHLDRRLTWKEHIEMKRHQIKIMFSKMYWLIGRHSKLSLKNKVLLYKSIIMPIWTYGIQLWGSTSASNKDILQRSQSKILRNIINAPWYIRNANIQSDLGVKTVNEMIRECSKKYLLKLEVHPNELARDILKHSKYRRLQRTDPLDLMNI